jgi:hypothetical protein
MKLYWSTEVLTGASVIRTSAKSITIDPTGCAVTIEKTGVFGSTNAGTHYEKIRSEYQAIFLIVEEDQLRLNRTVFGETKSVADWLGEWENADVKWIENTDRGIDDPVRVVLRKLPERSFLNDNDLHRRFEYDLVEKEEHDV